MMSPAIIVCVGRFSLSDHVSQDAEGCAPSVVSQVLTFSPKFLRGNASVIQCLKLVFLTVNLFMATKHNSERTVSSQHRSHSLRHLSLSHPALDSHCYSATMAALAKADPPQIDQVEILLDDMQRAGIEPNNVTYDIAIRAYLDAGKTPSAENLYEAMKKAGVQPLNDLRRRLEASKKEPTVD